MKSEFICPYCFTKNKTTSVQLQCKNPRCDKEVDMEYTRYMHADETMPTKRGRCFPVKIKGRLPLSGECPQCGQTSYQAVCPACHNPLPEATLDGTDMIISVVGARGTGKSVYVGVLINELKHRIAPDFGGSLEGHDDSLARYKDNFFKRMYEDENKKLPDQTASSMTTVNNGAYMPYIFTLRLPKTGLFAGKQVNCFTFVFFDTAGEDLDNPDIMSVVNKYIAASSGIIFLLDPLQIPDVHNALDEQTIKGATSVGYGSVNDPNSIMTNVARLIRNMNQMREGDKIKIPVAATFSKFDAIESIVPNGMTIETTSPHASSGIFDMSDWNNVNSEVKGLLQEWDYADFITQVENNYTNCAYFVVSALGLHNNPRLDQSIDKPHPHRVEDPLLWLLKENGVIKATKFKG